MNSPATETESPEIKLLRVRRVVAWGVVAAFLVAGVRLVLVGLWGGSVPYLDECNQTGWLHLFASRSSFGIPFAWLFEPHMEHRIATQRVFSLTLTGLNGGQWNPGLELRAAALLWGLWSGFLAVAGGRLLPSRWLPLWTGLVVAAGAIPHAWENLLWAFQVQFVFVAAFSLLALWLLTTTRPLARGWWMGVASGVAACVSQGAGILVWPAAATVLLARLWKSRPRDRRDLAAVAILSVGTALAAWAAPQVPAHQPLHAADVATWLRALGGLLAWPWSSAIACGPLLWLPGIVFIVSRMTTPGPRRDGDWFVVSWLVWALAVAATSAWARGNLLAVDVPPSRYGDILIPGVLGNGWVVVHWGSIAGAFRWVRAAVCGAWLVAVLSGLAWYTLELSNRATAASNISRVSLSQFVESREIHENAFRSYVRTRNPSDLEVVPPIYPVPEHLADTVDRLERAGRWPAVLDGDPRSNPPALSRLSQSGTGAGIGLIAASMAIAAVQIVRSVRRTTPATES